MQRAALYLSSIVQRLTRGTYVLTIVVVIIMIVQVAVAIYLANQ
jgi:hypothetical protein